jgi:phosphoribosylamine--glycine ligase
VRFGDPECQALMLRLHSDLLELLLAAAAGKLASAPAPQWAPDTALTVRSCQPKPH